MKSSLNVYNDINKTVKLNNKGNLPYIKKKGNRSMFAKDKLDSQKSSYLKSVQHITADVHYDTLNVLQINKQHKQLKEILKKMNYDTMNYLDVMGPKTFKTKQRKQTSSSVLQLRNRDVDNNQKILSHYQHQIQRLTQRSNLLEDYDKGYFIEKIKTTQKTIQHFQTQNRHLRWQIDKKGKIIVKEQASTGQLAILQQQSQILQQKVKRLRAQDEKCIIEIKNLYERSDQIRQPYKKVQGELIRNKSKNPEDKLKKLQFEFNEKKNNLETLKKKQEVNIQHWQFRYYRCLKNIQSISSFINDTSQKITDTQSHILQSKSQISQLQEQLKSLKKKKIEKDKDLNQFLQKSHLSERKSDIQDINDLSNAKKQETNRTVDKIFRNENKQINNETKSQNPSIIRNSFEQKQLIQQNNQNNLKKDVGVKEQLQEEILQQNIQ